MKLRDLLGIWSPEDKICILHSDTAKCLFEGFVSELQENNIADKYNDCLVEYATIQEGEILLLLINA